MLVGSLLLLFSFELVTVMVSLPVVEASEFNFSSPLVSDVSLLLRRFDRVSDSVNFFAYFFESILD